MTEKIRELAEKLTAYNLKYGHPSPDDVMPYVDILRAELKPLLDAAQAVYDSRFKPADEEIRAMEYLRIELKGWQIP